MLIFKIEGLNHVLSKTFELKNVILKIKLKLSVQKNFSVEPTQPVSLPVFHFHLHRLHSPNFQTSSSLSLSLISSSLQIVDRTPKIYRLQPYSFKIFLQSFVSVNDVAVLLHRGFLCSTFDSLHSPAPELQSLRRDHGGDTSGVKNLHQSGVSSSSACLVKGFGLYSLQQQVDDFIFLFLSKISNFETPIYLYIFFDFLLCSIRSA